MEMKPPVFVGVTIHADQGGEGDVYPGHPLLYVERHTIELLKSAGLVPFLIPVFRDGSLPPLDHLKGFVFTGGGYLDLSRPRSQLAGLGTTGNERYTVEKRLIEYGLERDLPMIGFCRGAQMINHVLGGTLENIPEDGCEHHQEKEQIPGDQPVHIVALSAGSRFKSIMDVDFLEVNSFHRQHMASLGVGLRAAAISLPDGLIEVFESEDHPFLYGFQFHPEQLYLKQPIWNQFFQQFTLSVTNPIKASPR